MSLTTELTCPDCGLQNSVLADCHLLKDSRVTSRGTEVDLARRLPTGTARSAPPGSLDNLSVDLLAKERERELLSLDEVLMQSLKMTSEKANRETRF